MGFIHYARYPKLFQNNDLLKVHLKRLSTDALESVKILDLTRIVAGPFCTMTLGDLGAEVFKIEQPGVGDETRLWPPNLNNNEKGLSCYFASLNRNKKSICVNLKSTLGKNIIYKLAQECDVLVENYVPGKMDEMGLGYDTISKIAPNLIYCSLSGYGPVGPYRQRPGYDVIAASVGGLLHITGPKDGEPCKAGVAMTDLATGLYAHGAILAALFQRTKTNKGQKIDCNLLSTQIACLINIGGNYLNAGKEGTRWGTAHESIVPYESFKTADGYITVGAGSNSQFLSLCDKLGTTELAQDPKFSTNALRVLNRETLIKQLKPHFLSRSTSDLCKLFEGASFPNGPVNTLSQVFEDRHVEEIGLVKEVKLENNYLKMVGPPVLYSDSQNCIRSPPPQLGQHTRQVLAHLLNYSVREIDELLKDNIIQ